MASQASIPSRESQSQPFSSISSDILINSDATLNLSYVGRGKKCFKWTQDTKSEFETWFQNTTWSKRNSILSDKERKTIYWGSQKSAYSWAYYCEGADRSNGQPKVICTRCDEILNHPAFNGTSGLDKHIQSSACQRASKSKGFTQLAITDGFRKAVTTRILPEYYPNPIFAILTIL